MFHFFVANCVALGALHRNLLNPFWFFFASPSECLAETSRPFESSRELRGVLLKASLTTLLQPKRALSFLDGSGAGLHFLNVLKRRDLFGWSTVRSIRDL